MGDLPFRIALKRFSERSGRWYEPFDCHKIEGALSPTMDHAVHHDASADTALSDYREFPPPAPLAGYLLCLWTQTILGSRGEFAQRVLPDACIDLVLINDEAPMVIGPDRGLRRTSRRRRDDRWRTVPSRTRAGPAQAASFDVAEPVRHASRHMGRRSECAVCANRWRLNSSGKEVSDGGRLA